MTTDFDLYKPYSDRTPDTQYRDRLAFILERGVRLKDTPQGVGAITCFGELEPMVFDLSNGAPLITERKIGFWKKGVAEIIAFINGARRIDDIESFGCDFWKDYRGKGSLFGLDPDDLGPASYGGAFHDFPMPGGSFNQFAHVLEQIKKYPSIRTLLVTPWIPFQIGRGPGQQKAVVSPCHGWLHFRVFGDRLSMRMDQRSADFPIGVPSNMIQYAALLMMVAQVTGLKPWKFIHSFSDAHIYEDQEESVRELLKRDAKRFPTLLLNPNVTNLFAFRIEDFQLTDYDAHPSLKIAYRP
jgi:thymidylate synthase